MSQLSILVQASGSSTWDMREADIREVREACAREARDGRSSHPRDVALQSVTERKMGESFEKADFDTKPSFS